MIELDGSGIFMALTCKEVLVVLFRLYSSACCCLLSLEGLRNDKIEVGFRLSMIFLSIGGMIL